MTVSGYESIGIGNFCLMRVLLALETNLRIARELSNFRADHAALEADRVQQYTSPDVQRQLANNRAAGDHRRISVPPSSHYR